MTYDPVFLETYRQQVFNLAERIIEIVCEEFEVKVEDIKSRKRYATIARARQICVSILVKYTPLNLKEIGCVLGRLDHSTIMYARNTAKDLCEVDKMYRQQVLQVEAIIKTNLNLEPISNLKRVR